MGKVPAETWTLLGQEHPNGTADYKMTKPGCQQGSTKRARGPRSGKARNEGILRKAKQSGKGCTMEVAARQDDRVEQVCGHDVGEMGLVITNAAKHYDKPITYQLEVVEVRAETTEMGAALLLYMRWGWHGAKLPVKAVPP